MIAKTMWQVIMEKAPINEIITCLLNTFSSDFNKARIIVPMIVNVIISVKRDIIPNKTPKVSTNDSFISPGIIKSSLRTSGKAKARKLKPVTFNYIPN